MCKINTNVIISHNFFVCNEKKKIHIDLQVNTSSMNNDNRALSFFYLLAMVF